MKKTIAAILLFVSSIAVAGEELSFPVTIDTVARYAIGDMRTAHVSMNAVEAIGCSITAIDDGAGGAFEYTLCEATDSAGNYVSCWTQNPAMGKSVTAISDFSLIWFAWDGINCTEIGTYSKSSYLGKLK